MLAYDWEGTDIAKWLNTQGIAAFVLKYRLPNSADVLNENNVSLKDTQRAIQWVRFHAKKWNVSPEKVGIMGFSAGGHLASTVGTHITRYVASGKSPLDSISVRPDFLVLLYPVISMNAESTHMGSRIQLIGENPTQQWVQRYSNEQQVTKETPPTFLVHATDDNAVPVTNTVLFYQALVKAGVSAEMHVYPTGGHGFALAVGKGYLQTWSDRLADWLRNLN
jgi:acetyl esterase/lipase